MAQRPANPSSKAARRNRVLRPGSGLDKDLPSADMFAVPTVLSRNRFTGCYGRSREVHPASREYRDVPEREGLLGLNEIMVRASAAARRSLEAPARAPSHQHRAPAQSDRTRFCAAGSKGVVGSDGRGPEQLLIILFIDPNVYRR